MAGIIAAMPSLHADHALLPTGWARDVLLEWDEAGMLARVTANAPREGHERAAGPVLPGMPNVHSHAFQRAMAGLAETRGHATDDFWTWRETMYALVERVEPEDVEAIAAHLYIEMLKHGYTTVGEFHYLHHDRGGRPYGDKAELAHSIAGAAAASGIALTLMPVMYAYGGFGHAPLGRAQQRFRSDPAFIVELLEELTRWHLPSPLMRLGVAPHSARAIDALMLTDLVAAARAMDPTMPIHMHVSEQRREVEECLATHAATPFSWIAQLVDVDARWCLIHSTHLTEDERQSVRACGAVPGLCPSTEANLGDGIFDFAAWWRDRGAWGIGGDSHVCVDPFRELRTVEETQRLVHRVRNVTADLDRPDVAANLWNGAAQGGAQALGHPVGRLAPGCRADLVVLEADDADFESLDGAGMLGVAMFSGNRAPVRDVFVGGRIVVGEGRHPDEDEARAAFRRSLARLRSPS